MAKPMRPRTLTPEDLRELLRPRLPDLTIEDAQETLNHLVEEFREVLRRDGLRLTQARLDEWGNIWREKLRETSQPRQYKLTIEEAQAIVDDLPKIICDCLRQHGHEWTLEEAQELVENERDVYLDLIREGALQDVLEEILAVLDDDDELDEE